MNTLAVDALPVELEHKFIKAMYEKSQFWGDMMRLCLTHGFRNSEARNLKVSEINGFKITLGDSKGQRAHVTKTANKAINSLWITQAQMFLYEVAIEKNDMIRAASADLLDSESALSKLAIKLNVSDSYAIAKKNHYDANISKQRELALKTAPKGRVIDFSRCLVTKNIISARIDKALAAGSEYLFPTNELKGGRASSTGFEPVSRQAVYNCIKSVKNALVEHSASARKALTGIRISLHSMRKAAVQRVSNLMGDILAASIWIGHGSGKGDLATTQSYLDKSSKRMDEINEKLATLSA